MPITGVLVKLSRWRRFSDARLLEWYPPFLFMGVKVTEVARDYRKIRVEKPLRWYGKNMYGSMFGGFLAAVTDPLPALMCQRIFPGCQGWTKSHYVDFLKPARNR